MNKRIPAIVSLGFALLIVLGLATSLILNYTLRRSNEESKAVKELIAKARGNIRDLKTDYFQRREEVAALVLDPGSRAEFEERSRKRKNAGANASGHAAVALGATRSEELKRSLRKLLAYDEKVCAAVEAKILLLATTDGGKARALYRKEYLPAEREKTAIADEALRLAFVEVDTLDAKAATNSRRAEIFAHSAIVLFLGVGLFSAVFFRRIIGKVVRLSETATRENKEMVEHSLDVICAIDADGNFTSLNGACQRVFGYSASELRGTPYLRLVHADDLEKTQHVAAQIRAGAPVRDFDNRYVRKDGAVVHIMWSARWSEEQGQMFCVARDGTERKATEAALQEAEQKYRLIFEHSTDGIFQNTPDGQFISANPALVRMLGFESAEELIRERNEIGRQGWAQPALRAEFKKRLERDGSVIGYEYEVYRKNGTRIWVSESTRVVRDEEGPSLFYEGSVHDITDRKRAEAEVLESKRFLRSTLDALSSHIAILDENGTIVEVNRAWNMFAEENQIRNRLRGVGDNYLDLCDAARGSFSDEAPAMAAGIRAVMAGKRDSFELEYPCHGPREERWFVARVTRFKGAGEVRVVVAHENISARKRAELELKGSEERFQLVARATDDAIWDWNVVANTITFSESFGNLFGYRAGGFESKKQFWVQNIHPDDQEAVIASMHGFFASREESWSSEYRFRCADGSYASVHDRGFVVRDADGAPLRMVGSMMNITGRKRAEDALALSGLRLAEAQRIAQVGSWEWDVKTDALTWSDEKWRLFGYAPSTNLVTREFQLNCVLPEDRPAALAWIAGAHATGKPEPADFRIVRPDAEVRVMQTRAHGMLDESGQVIRLLGTSQDVTEQRRAESDLRAAKADAEAANRAKSEFLANMSHEIRTPMNGIIGMTDLALETDLNCEQREYLGMVKSSALALLGLINNILDFSKIEAGKLELEAIEFGLRETLEHMLKPLVLRAEQKGLELRADIADDVPSRLIGDPLRLGQIMLNFVDNALKFTEHGSITVKVAAEAGPEKEACLHFSVTDTGVGVAPEKQDVIFQAFAQVDSSTTRHYGGTGLGLAIASRLVEQMRGKIWIESILGQGTTFHFTACFGVSSCPSSAWILSSDLRTRTKDEGENEKKAALHILLAEDNVINRAVATGILTRHGHAVVYAGNGREAVEAAARQTFDLIFMDVQMPEMDGFEATQRIREIEEPLGRRTPIVAMTAHAMSGDRERCLAAGMDDYISKPLDKKKLLEILSISPKSSPPIHSPPNAARHYEFVAETV